MDAPHHKDRTLKGRAQESAKLALRHGLSRLNLDIGRDPYSRRLVRTLASRNIGTVIDVGANVGQFATQLRHAGFTGRIVSVEPLSAAFAELTRRAARDPKWDCVNAAIGDGEGTGTIHVSANSYSSSLLTMTDAHTTAAPGSESITTEQVAMMRLTDLVDARKIAPAATLLKVDTQGFEGRVLDSAGALLEEFAAIQLELSFVELYEGQPLHDELVARLRSAGFTFWSMETGFSAPDGRLLQIDGLFVRA